MREGGEGESPPLLSKIITNTTCRADQEMSRLEPIPVFVDLLIQESNTAGDRHDCAVALQREVAPLPHPNTTDLGSSARLGRFGCATRCARSIFHRGMPPDFGLTFGISSVETVGREGHRKSV